MSKELEALERLYKCNDDDYTLGYQQHDYNLLKQALIKSQEQEKELDNRLIFENGQKMSGFDYKGKQIVAMPLEEYDDFEKQDKALKIIKNKFVMTGYILSGCPLKEYNSCIKKQNQLTQEEYDLLKEVLEND